MSCVSDFSDIFLARSSGGGLGPRVSYLREFHSEGLETSALWSQRFPAFFPQRKSQRGSFQPIHKANPAGGKRKAGPESRKSWFAGRFRRFSDTSQVSKVPHTQRFHT